MNKIHDIFKEGQGKAFRYVPESHAISEIKYWTNKDGEIEYSSSIPSPDDKRFVETSSRRAKELARDMGLVKLSKFCNSLK